MLDASQTEPAGITTVSCQTRARIAASPRAHAEQQSAVRDFDLGSADPQSVEHQLSSLYTENLRLQSLVTELLIKNQQLRAANCGA
jgi:hypothetical protein